MSKAAEQLTPSIHCPIGWAVKSFGEVCSMRTEKFDPIGGVDTPYVALEHLEQDNGRLLGVGNSSDTTSIKAVFKENDILFGKLRPYLRKYWHTTFDGVCSTEIMPLTPKDELDNRFAFYVVQQEKFIDHSIRHSFGTKMPRTSWKEVSDFQCLVPPLSEQRKIAAILSSVDDAIIATQRIVNQTEIVKRGLMQRLLTKGIGHTTFKHTEIGEVPIDWDVYSLSDLFHLKHGFAFKSEYFSDSGSYVLLTPGNFEPAGGLKLKGEKEKYYTGDVPQEYILNSGDLLVVMTDLTQECKILGSPAIVPSDNMFLHNQRLGKVENIETDKVTVEYLYHLFNASSYRNHLRGTATGTTVRHTSPSRIGEVKVAIPPLDEQAHIVSILASVDEEIRSEMTYQSQLVQVKGGLMQVLLTGKVRVNVDVASEVSV